MTKAFNKAEKVLKKSIDECQSDEAWNEDNKQQFYRCTQKLSRLVPWIMQIYQDVEQISAHEGDSINNEFKIACFKWYLTKKGSAFIISNNINKYSKYFQFKLTMS